MKRLAFLVSLLAILALAPGGTTVRGLLYRVGPDGRNYPASGISTRLTHPAYGPSSFSYSDGGGMYYLYNVPPGDFTLEVWLSPQNVWRFPVRALPQAFTDVPAIRVP